MSVIQKLAKDFYPELDELTVQKVEEYKKALISGNLEQNLTRITSDEEFFDRNISDCVELIRSGFIEYPAFDLGSGGGVPGLITLILEKENNKKWILNDSEKRKADFLEECLLKLNLKLYSKTTPERAEIFLSKNSVNSIVSRAVGKIDKIMGWIGDCSTWNNIILLKGPSWEQEWEDFLKSKHRKKLKISGIHNYLTPLTKKELKIIKLTKTVN